jgi:hypothetical protein
VVEIDWEKDFEKILNSMEKKELIEIIFSLISKDDALNIMYEYWKKKKII